MSWEDEPATEQQLIHLRNAGCTVAHPLTRTEAARLIRSWRKNPGQGIEPSSTRSEPATLQSAPAPQRSAATQTDRDISEATRMHVCRLRQEAERAARALATNPGAPNARADAAATTTSRREFWLDTCREFKDMRIASMQVFELYQNYGCRFFAPDQGHVQEILDALDAAMPLWDRDHPELFYQALELNLPHLARKA